MAATAKLSTARVVVLRAVRTLALALFACASLLAFPNALPWIVAAWLAWHAVLLLGGRPSWLPLAGCGAVMVAKNPALLPGLGVLLVAVLAECALLGFAHYRSAGAGGDDDRRGISGSVTAAACILLAAGWICFALDWWAVGRFHPRPSNGRPIVLLGDSLTAEMPPFGSYADRLRTLVPLEVINLGQPGITTAEAMELLPDAIAARPQVVVVELGGHDYLKGHSRAETHANLVRIIGEIQAAGSAVVLVEVPRGLIRDPYRGMERRLARRHNLALVPDTPLRRLVLQSRTSPLDGIWPLERLSEDGIHPNAQGNRLLAGYVAEAIRRVCETHP